MHLHGACMLADLRTGASAPLLQLMQTLLQLLNGTDLYLKCFILIAIKLHICRANESQTTPALKQTNNQIAQTCKVLSASVMVWCWPHYSKCTTQVLRTNACDRPGVYKAKWTACPSSYKGHSYVSQVFTVQEHSRKIAADCIQNATTGEALLGHSAYPIQDLCELPHKRAMWRNPCKSMYMSQSNILKAKARKRTQWYKTNASAWHAHPVVHYILYICTLS